MSLTSLPEEVFLRVLLFLTPIEIVRCGLVNRQFRQACLSEELWASLYSRSSAESSSASRWEAQLKTMRERFFAREKTQAQWERGTFNIRPFDDHSGFIRTLCLDRNHMYAGSQSSVINVYHVASKQLVRVLEGHTDAVTGLVCAPHGRLFSASGDGTVREWDVGSGECLAVIRAHFAAVVSLHAHAFTNRLYTASLDGTVRVWSLSGRGSVAVLREAHPTALNCVSADEAVVAAGADSGHVYLWDAGSLEPQGAIRAHAAVVFFVHVAPDELISASQDGSVKSTALASRETRFHTRDLHQGPLGVTCAAVHGSRVVTGGFEYISILDRTDGRLLHRINAHPNALVRDVKVEADAIFTTGFNRRIVSWSFVRD